MITHIVGTRPNDIKCAALYPELQKKNVEQKVFHTGQHFSVNMAQHLVPIEEYGRITNKIGEMIEWLIPRVEGTVVVYGDTNTTLAGCVAAKQKGLRVAHVEAGMRCGDGRMIEEVNRIMVDSISDMNFLTSDIYSKNVENGIVVGDVQYDLFKQRLEQKVPIEEGFPLLTLHRAEHTEDPKKLRALLALIHEKFDWPVNFVMHPRTLAFCVKHNIGLDGFAVRDPMSYPEFQTLLLKAGSVITDSGGVSKEAAWALKPLYILRSVSEWGLPTVGAYGENWREIRREELKIESGDGRAASRIAALLAAESSSLPVSLVA